MWAWLIPIFWVLFGFVTYPLLKRDWLRDNDWTVEDRRLTIFLSVLLGPIGSIVFGILLTNKDGNKVLEKRNDRQGTNQNPQNRLTE